jgi:hypothetical protein
MKEFYFLTGLPRAGNTLLGSLVNQNKNVAVTAHSIIVDMLHSLDRCKNLIGYENFPDEKSFMNVSKKMMESYYEHWEANHIIDRGPWGTPPTLNLLKKLTSKRKFVILYRPVLECLASFIRLDNNQVEHRCDELMSERGMIGNCLWSTRNVIKSNEEHIIIHFKEYTPLDFNNLKQFETNGVTYDDSVFPVKLHEIRTDKISLNEYDIETYLPESIIKRYKGEDI